MDPSGFLILLLWCLSLVPSCVALADVDYQPGSHAVGSLSGGGGGGDDPPRRSNVAPGRAHYEFWEFYSTWDIAGKMADEYERHPSLQKFVDLVPVVRRVDPASDSLRDSAPSEPHLTAAAVHSRGSINSVPCGSCRELSSPFQDGLCVSAKMNSRPVYYRACSRCIWHGAGAHCCYNSRSGMFAEDRSRTSNKAVRGRQEITRREVEAQQAKQADEDLHARALAAGLDSFAGVYFAPRHREALPSLLGRATRLARLEADTEDPTHRPASVRSRHRRSFSPGSASVLVSGSAPLSYRQRSPPRSRPEFGRVDTPPPPFEEVSPINLEGGNSSGGATGLFASVGTQEAADFGIAALAPAAPESEWDLTLPGRDQPEARRRAVDQLLGTGHYSPGGPPPLSFGSVTTLSSARNPFNASEASPRQIFGSNPEVARRYESPASQNRVPRLRRSYGLRRSIAKEPEEDEKGKRKEKGK